jgi:shikimate dehydrogenase
LLRAIRLTASNRGHRNILASKPDIRLGLIGRGISRTQVGRLHVALGQLCGLDVSYDLFDADTDNAFDFSGQLRICAGEGYRGVNVTHPFKPEPLKHCAPMASLPTGLRAANTVIFEPDGWRAGNTDYSGFLCAWRHRFGEETPGRVLMIGAGGVGVALGHALARLGADEIVIHDKDIPLAETLVAAISRGVARARLAGQFESGQPAAEMKAADGLVNATPVGMAQYPGNPFAEQGIGGQKWAFDAIYTPLETDFLRLCKARGVARLSGFELFLYQGLDAFEIFTGLPVGREAALAALKETQDR